MNTISNYFFKHLTFLTLICVSGCATLTPTKETVEGFKIYDLPVTYSSTLTFKLSSSLKKAMQENTDSVRFDNTLPPPILPSKVKRFELTNPFSNAKGIMALTGRSIKMPKCEGSVIEATSHDKFAGAENTTFFVCLIPYVNGYKMNIYYTFTKVSGGFTSEALGRSLAQAFVGDSSQFIPKTILALENAIKENGVDLRIEDSYPTNI